MITRADVAGAGAKEPRVALGAKRVFGGFREREGRGLPGMLVGQGKLWTLHPSGPGSPRAARDCASRLERDAVTAKYAMHISSLLAKPHVIARPSYVQLKEAFSPAGTIEDTGPCWIPALAEYTSHAL